MILHIKKDDLSGSLRSHAGNQDRNKLYCPIVISHPDERMNEEIQLEDNLVDSRSQ
ncbi:MAG: hypothetical protein K9G11_04070 [Rickettsiaceae bacterium]|nr:hypothetical protein [Rickettsiaceae bacterium]